jgi:pseudouridine-5'-phosphate glycosidase
MALSRDAVEAAINQAFAGAEAQGVRGRDVTPFLLARVAELTGGASLAANVALLGNNAAVAAKIATCS